MTPNLTVNLLRTLFVVFTTCLGLLVGDAAFNSGVTGTAGGVIFGLSVVLIDRLIKGVSLRTFSSATFGLLVGFIFSQLLLSSRLLAGVPGQTQWVIGLAVYSTFGYLGMMLAIRSNRDELALIIPYVRFRQAALLEDPPTLVDTNILIDGRIVALSATGFLSSSLVIPRFVLEELQRLADSRDLLKKERGKNGLDRVQQLQQMTNVQITIHELQPDLAQSVDTQLAQLAKNLGARLLTNDANLSALARIQGVTVLNLNDLTQAVRPPIATGDRLDLALVKEGREPHQAIGYLADGTMIVVNHGREYLHETVPVTISSALQTNAGRLYFAELRGSQILAR